MVTLDTVMPLSAQDSPREAGGPYPDMLPSCADSMRVSHANMAFVSGPSSLVDLDHLRVVVPMPCGGGGGGGLCPLVGLPRIQTVSHVMSWDLVEKHLLVHQQTHAWLEWEGGDLYNQLRSWYIYIPTCSRYL